MSDSVSSMPIGAIVSRVWSGTHWHYPNVERLLAELAAARKVVEEARNAVVYLTPNGTSKRKLEAALTAYEQEKHNA